MMRPRLSLRVSRPLRAERASAKPFSTARSTAIRACNHRSRLKSHGGTDSNSERATLPWFSRAAQQSCSSSGIQKNDETDFPNAGDRSDLDHWETIHLCVSEIAPRAVRRCNRVEIFACHPINRKSKRRLEGRAAPQKTAHEQNTQTENHGRN